MAVSREDIEYVSDSRNNRVRRITADGALQTVAGGETQGDTGDDSPATEARFNEPYGLCLYGDDILLISDHHNSWIKAVKLR